MERQSDIDKASVTPVLPGYSAGSYLVTLCSFVVFFTQGSWQD